MTRCELYSFLSVEINTLLQVMTEKTNIKGVVVKSVSYFINIDVFLGNGMSFPIQFRHEKFPHAISQFENSIPYNTFV